MLLVNLAHSATSQRPAAIGAPSRLFSEDPIQDGSNWYVAFGGDPINSSDPTGLSQAGYPLARRNAPLQTTTFGGFHPPESLNLSLGAAPGGNQGWGGNFSLDAAAGAPRNSYNASAFQGPINASYAAAAPSIRDFDRALSSSNILSRPTRSAAPSGPSLFDVMDGYSARYANDDVFRNRMDEDYSQGLALYDIQHGMPGEAFRARTMIGLNEMSGSFYPSAGEYQDYDALVSPESRWWQRGAAAGSLGLSLLTLGASPNVSASMRTLRADSHSLEAVVDAQRYTHQIDALPNMQVVSQFDTYSVPSGTLPNEVRGGAYLLRNPETGQVMRTGRTGDLLRRQGEHARDLTLKGYDFEPTYRTNIYAEQRGLEQLLHNTYYPPLNRINPISPTNPNRPTYLDAADRFLNQQGGR